MKKHKKITYQAASLAMQSERERVVRDAQSTMMKTQCFTDALLFGMPFEIGEGKPAIRSLGWARPDQGVPNGCELIARVPISGLTELQACRLLADRMQNFPAFNCAEIA